MNAYKYIRNLLLISVLQISVGAIFTEAANNKERKSPEKTSQKTTSKPSAAQISAEIKRVFDGLSPAVEANGENPKRMRLEERMRDYKVPGIGIVLIENGQVRWAQYLGVKEASTSEKINPQTRFMVQSLSKSVTAFATLRLTDKGIVKLDNPLKQYLKSWTIPSNEFTAKTEPTLRQLLSHSAGFTVFGVPSYEAGESLPTLIQALNGVSPAKPGAVQIDYEPGTKTRYSGGGYSVLQQLLQDMSGTDFPRFMENRVLRPIGMNQSLFYPGMPLELVSTAAVGHQNDGTPIKGKWQALVQLAAGGLISTPTDMAKFDLEIMRGWQGKSKLLSQKTAREMLNKQKDKWGLGFEINGEGNEFYFLHTGSGVGFRAIIVGFPANGQGAVILTNSNSGSELRYELLRSMAREYKWNALQVTKRQTVSLDSPRLNTLSGLYEFTDKSVAGIFIREGNLFFKWRNLDPTRLYAASSKLFFSEAGEEFEFVDNEFNQPTKLTWRGDFGEFIATRK